MSLALRRLDHEHLRLAGRRGGVIKAAMRASADEAHDVIDQAKREAARLMEAVRAEARHEQAQERCALERQLWQHAAGYAQALEAEWGRATAELEDRLALLLGHALRRLVEQVPSEERVRTCLRHLIEQAGTPDSGTLLVSPDALDGVKAMGSKIPWPVEAREDLPPHTVRLVSAHGRWECAIATVIERLAAALVTTDQTD